MPLYIDLLSAMIHDWRTALRDADLPFVLVQIADYAARDDDAWHGIQRAQLEAPRSIRLIETVLSADISESDCIHPPTKAPLARRVWDTIARGL